MSGENFSFNLEKQVYHTFTEMSSYTLSVLTFPTGKIDLLRFDSERHSPGFLPVQNSIYVNNSLFGVAKNPGK